MTEQDKNEFKEILKGYQDNTDALIKKLSEESKEEIKHYMGALSESHQHTIDAIKEDTKDVPEIKRMVTMMFENMGKQEIDIEVLKESVRDHERRLQKVER